MYLITKQRRPKVSTRKITCYKVVKKLNDGYRTPFANETVCDGSIEGAKMSCTFRRTDKRLNVFDKIEVGKGVIHSFSACEKAVCLARVMNMSDFYDFEQKVKGGSVSWNAQSRRSLDITKATTTTSLRRESCSERRFGHEKDVQLAVRQDVHHGEG